MAKLPRHELAKVLAERLLNLPEKRLATEVAAYLLADHRTGELDSLLRDIMQYRADHGVVEVVVVSAHELSDKVRRDIEAQVRQLYPQAKTIIISEERDPALIGGVRIELANEQLDLSVRASLNRFKQLTAVGE